MKQRIISGVALLVLLLPCVYIGGLPLQILLILVSLIGVFEILSICNRPKAKLYLYPLIAIFVLYSVLFEAQLLISSEVMIIFLLILLTCGVLDVSLQWNRICYYFVASVLVAMGFHMIYQIRLIYGFNYLLLLALATFGSDTGAYFVGRQFGKHKLNPRLSPKKTIEGSIGGIVVGTVFSVLFGTYFQIDMNIMVMIIVCMILTMTGQVGDLTFSSIKRNFEVKDFSQLIPGHGGILDRFDSILFNAMTFGIILHVLQMVVTR